MRCLCIIYVLDISQGKTVLKYLENCLGQIILKKTIVVVVAQYDLRCCRSQTKTHTNQRIVNKIGQI